MITSEALAVWLAHHPRVRRALATLLFTFTASAWALATAPAAAASAGAATLGWTGITDTDNVPIADYFLAVVDTLDAVTNNGQDISAIDPTTWLPWMAKAFEAAVTHALVAYGLTLIATGYIVLMGLALWFLRFALSSAWLVLLAKIGQPVYSAVNTLVNKMWLGPIAVTLCLCVAGLHFARGRSGRAWGVAGAAVIVYLLSITIFADPIADLYSDNGLLAMGRSTGMTIVDIAHNGSYDPGKPLDAQLHTFIAQITTATVRNTLQTFNFGQVVDNTGNCRAAWSTAIRAAHGSGGDGPAQAIKDCGAAMAFAHAQHLGADDAIIGALLLVAGFCFAAFLLYVGMSALLVGVKADFYGIVIGPALLLAMTGIARFVTFAKHAAGQLLQHAIEMAAFIAYLGVVINAMHWLLTTTQFGLGEPSSSVMPRIFMLMVASILAALGFRVLDHSFRTDGLGAIAHQISSAAMLAGTSVRGHYDDAHDGVDRARGLADRFRSRSGSDDDADGADASNADDAPGFDTVKPRPVPPKTAPAAAGTSAIPTGGGTAAEAAGAETAAETATVAAEGLGTVAAPEVALPAVAVLAARHHHQQHETNTTLRASSGGNRQPNGHSVQARPDPTPFSDGQPGSHPTIGAPGSMWGPDPDIAPQAASGRRGRAPEAAPLSDDSSTYDVAPQGVEAPPIEACPADPTLEFPTSSARPPADPSGNHS